MSTVKLCIIVEIYMFQNDLSPLKTPSQLKFFVLINIKFVHSELLCQPMM